MRFVDGRLLPESRLVGTGRDCSRLAWYLEVNERRLPSGSATAAKRTTLPNGLWLECLVHKRTAYKLASRLRAPATGNLYLNGRTSVFGALQAPATIRRSDHQSRSASAATGGPTKSQDGCVIVFGFGLCGAQYQAAMGHTLHQNFVTALLPFLA